jgi:hypothetical protein
MGIDFNDAEGIEPELLEEAKNGEATMKTTVSTDAEAMKLTNRGGGGGNNKSIDEVIRDSEQNLTKVRQIISQGGFSGPEKDKYELSLAHAEWVHARNTERKCDNDVRETSVKYTALVNGKAQTHEINKAHSDWKTKRETCKKIDSELLEKANKYIEVDRRVRQNKKAADEYPATLPSGSTTTTRERFQVARSGGSGDEMDVEGFTGTKEGFDFYNGSVYEDKQQQTTQVVFTDATQTTPAVMKFNVRLPQYDDPTRGTDINNEGKAGGATILPWSEYYVNCQDAPSGTGAEVDALAAKKRCINANKEKDKYIKTINHEFDRADRLLNIFYNIKLKSSFRGNQRILDPTDIASIIENQKKNIALNKQNAIYDYDEYNSLSFYEDLVLFLYYAVFAIFVLMSLREFFSSSGAYDKRNIVILVLLGLYPKYILTVVLWLLNGLTNIASILGLKNVRFWKSAE